MRGFEAEGPIPDWLSEYFDEATTLPKGPLEMLPIPIEGIITKACASSPKDAHHKNWSVVVETAESTSQCARFFGEFLPLTGYDIVAYGVMRSRRFWKTKVVPNSELFVIQRDGYYGTITLINGDNVTRIEVEMGHPNSDPYKSCSDLGALSQRTDVEWRQF